MLILKNLHKGNEVTAYKYPDISDDNKEFITLALVSVMHKDKGLLPLE